MTKAKSLNTLNEEDLPRRRHQNIKSGISQQPLIGSYLNFERKLRLPNYILQKLKTKTTCDGRRSQTNKSEISQQPLIGSYSKA